NLDVQGLPSPPEAFAENPEVQRLPSPPEAFADNLDVQGLPSPPEAFAENPEVQRLPSPPEAFADNLDVQGLPSPPEAFAENPEVQRLPSPPEAFAENLDVQGLPSPPEAFVGRKSSGKSEREVELERRLNLEYKRRRKAECEQERLRQSVAKVLSPDQVRVLEKGTMRGSSWSPETLQKALHLKVACGSKGYDFVKENVVPLPAKRTLQKQMEHIKFRPGILDEVFAALKQRSSSLKPEERHACLLMDEMQLNPGLDYDASTGSIIGHPTIRPSNPEAKEELATHALVFMLAGLTTRWKQAVAYHFTCLS
ncbi:hypothetical protein MTO96_031986, partial [Rhipicephalus appendiculatus]